MFLSICAFCADKVKAKIRVENDVEFFESMYRLYKESMPYMLSKDSAEIKNTPLIVQRGIIISKTARSTRFALLL